MIAEHLEPKGLSPDTPPLASTEPALRDRKAKTGSRKLRDAIWKLQGYAPAVVVVVEPPKPRHDPVRRPEVCPTCLGPLQAPRRLIASIQQVVAAYYGLHPTAMTGADRRKHVSRPRQIAIYLASELTEHSIAEIGRRFKRDHTTVLHALKVVKLRCETDDDQAFDIALLRERLAG